MRCFFLVGININLKIEQLLTADSREREPNKTSLLKFSLSLLGNTVTLYLTTFILRGFFMLSGRNIPGSIKTPLNLNARPLKIDVVIYT